MKITGTFLDEISHDIPHQNWGRAEWDRDFAAMKSIGIDTVILIRSGHKRFLTFPSEYLFRSLRLREILVFRAEGAGIRTQPRRRRRSLGEIRQQQGFRRLVPES